MIKNIIIATLLTIVLFMSSILYGKTYVITVNDDHFLPSDLVISVNDDVVWVNSSKKEHNIGATTKNFCSFSLKPKEKFKFTFLEQDSFKYYSISRRKMGMLSFIEVR